MKTSLWFSWLTFSIAVAGLCLAIVRCEPIEADWAAILVGILGALVTALIGWQIYSIIDLRRTRNLMEQTRLDSLLDKERNSCTTCHAIADYYYSIVVGANPNSHEYNLIYYRISELYHASQLGDKGMCEAVIKVLNENIARPHLIKLSQANKKHIYELLLTVKDGMKMDGYQTLVEKIAAISVV